MVDLEDLDDDERGPHLIEAGRALARGRPTSARYVWSDERFRAAFGRGWVRISGEQFLSFGLALDDGLPRPVVDYELRLDTQTFRQVARTCAVWARWRARWAAFYYARSPGHPAGFAPVTCLYQAPGAKGELTHAGCWRPFGRRRKDDDLVGKNELVPVAPRRVGDGAAAIVAEIWRRGEKHGPSTGSLIGVRYQLDRRTHMDAYRREARIWDERGGEVTLEHGDEAFVEALLAVLSVRGTATQGRRR